ncbi:D-alanyl-D-alanine carboxypeptidase [Flagellimonas sp. S3867]|uniref:D-alanyl-D-alanine carboxypeptidase n=1 Tax=Flagellimonas sp. S3867 TaxID=2768063 RepID=UPI00168224A4|nr:D-alanyl-D-alanine carboxypeptidase [Flagellimonas sp. S3867]
MYLTYNQTVKNLTLIWLAGFFLLFGCSSSRLSKYDNQLKENTFQNSFHGLVVMDAETNKVLYNTNGEMYFTPASNTKIVTLFTGLKMIPEHFPALKYIENNDSLYVVPTGDPSWLHPYFKDSTAINFLKQKKNVAVFLENSEDERFGPGWAWEDYPYYFSAERSPLPLYGNVVSLSNIDGLEASPLFFLDSVQETNSSTGRDEFNNKFYINTEQQDTIQMPFIIKEGLTKYLLESLLKKEVTLLDSLPAAPKEVLYGVKSDSIYKRMMHVSDNFLAEQIMMTASSTLSDTLGIKRAMDHMLENELSFLDQKPRWVDGSGLSRYNLFTPKSFVQILQRLYQNVDTKRLFTLFPNWDATGTVSKWENLNMEPFIFAKSGSFGNNYNLSGYLKTKSGKVLIFSFMNNHFQIPSSEVRFQMYTLLKSLHEKH